MISGTTPVPIQREPELLGQTVVVIGRSAGRRINGGGTAPRLRGDAAYGCLRVPRPSQRMSNLRPIA